MAPAVTSLHTNAIKLTCTPGGIVHLACRDDQPKKVAPVALEISTRNTDEVTILDLRGRATMGGGESELLSTHLKQIVADGVRNLLLNLQELTHVDSSGVGIMVGTCVSLRRLGGDLKLLGAQGRVLQVLSVFRLVDVIESFDDEPQAVASFQPSA
jgi:anti-sigma B factor antagonist